MNSKEVTYPSLKYILEYLDPNLRFRLSHRIPSIRTAEKSTPLHIKFLELCSNLMQVNGTEYYMMCFQQQPLIDDPTFHIQEDKNKEGVPYDLNVYGLQDYGPEKHITPGDIEIEFADRERREEILRRSKEMQAMLEERTTQEGLVASEMNQTFLQFEINTYKGKIPGLEYLEALTHKRKIPEAAKYLYSKLLGGRRQPIQVFQLCSNEGTLRLPENLMLNVKTIRSYGNLTNIFNSMKGIVQEESIPLTWVSVDGSDAANPENYTHPWVHSAKNVQIFGKVGQEGWLDTISNINDQHILVSCEVSGVDIIELINRWTSFGRSIGTNFTFEIEDGEQVRMLFETLADRQGVIMSDIWFNGRSIKFPKLLVLPMNSYSECCVFCFDKVKSRKLYSFEIMVTPINHRNIWALPFES